VLALRLTAPVYGVGSGKRFETYQGVSYTFWGFPIRFGGSFLYDTYLDVSCMYPTCILKDTRIPNVS